MGISYRPDNPFAPPAPRPENPFVVPTSAGAVDQPLLDVTTRRAKQGNAEVMAEAFRIAQKMGLPPETVERNIDRVRAEMGDADFDAALFTERSPRTAQWLTDQANATVSAGDWNRLGLMERLMGRGWRIAMTGGGGMPMVPIPIPGAESALVREYQRGKAGLDLAQLSFYSTPSERAGMKQYLDSLRAEAEAELPEASGFLERSLRSMVGSVLPSLVEIGTESGKGAAVAGGSVGLASLLTGPFAPGVTGAAATLGGLAGGIKASYELLAGQFIDAFSNIEDAEGNRPDPLVADVTGRVFALPAAGLELVGAGTIARAFGPAASRLVAQATGRAIANRTARGAIIDGVTAWGKAVGGETLTETLQQGIQLAGEQAIRTGSSQPFEDIPMSRVADELATTAIETALGTFWLGAGAGGTTTMARLGKVAEAEATQQRMAALGDAATQSQLRERSPEQYRELVTAQVGGQDGVSHVYVPEEAFRTYFQKQGLDPAAVAKQLNASEAYQQAVATGGDVVIPFADWVTTIAPTEHHAALTPDVRFRPGALTPREASKEAEALETDIEKLKGDLDKMDLTEPSSQRIVDELTQALTAAAASMPKANRYTPAQIAKMAETIARPYAQLAAQSGEDAYEVFRSRNISILGPAQAEGAFDAAQGEALNQAALTTTTDPVLRGIVEGLDLRTRAKVGATFKRVVAEEVGADNEVAPEDFTELLGIALEMEGLARETDAGWVATTDPQVQGGRQLPQEVPVPTPLSKRESDALNAIEAHEIRAENPDATVAEIATLTGSTPAQVKKWLAAPKPRLSNEQVRDLGLRGAFVLEQAAFHGSPHVFDKFTTAKMGTGEGAQAYGWGLYFAENQGVAEGYHRTLSQDAYTVNGRPVSQMNDARRVAASDIVSRGYEKALADAEAAAVAVPEGMLTSRVEAYQADRRKLVAAIKAMKGKTVKKIRTGALYRVDIPDEAAAKFLDWDKPISADVAAAVRKAIPPERLEDYIDSNNAPLEEWRGREAYRYIERYADENPLPGDDVGITRGDEATSKFLLREGIPGIKFLDAGSRNARPQYRGDMAYVRAAESFKADGQSADEARAGLRKAYPSRPDFKAIDDAELDAAVDEAYDIQPVQTRNLVVFDESLITITHRNGDPVTQAERTEFLEQAQGAGPSESSRPNAFIRLGVSDRTIGLLQTANLTSVLHEFSHDWLDLMGELASKDGANESLQRDWQTVMKELGVTSREQIGTAEQERWARAFEKYLSEGKAPTVALQRAFARFKQWWRQVYRAALANFTPVSDELRGVFDRLLASEGEIANARLATEPMFDEKPEVMSDAQFAAYRQTVDDEVESSDARLLARMLDETRGEQRKGWKERRDALRPIIEAEVAQEPVQVAVRALREVAPEGRLNKAALVEAYGKGIVKQLPSGITTTEGGTTADLVAAVTGFDSAGALVDALTAFEPAKARVDRLLAERMQAEFPDLVGDSTALADAAQEEVHRGGSANGLVEELRALGRTNAAIPPHNLTATQTLAKEMIDQLPVRDIARAAEGYRLAEAKENKLAKEALASGDTARAAFHGRRQLLNHLLYRYAGQATQARDRALTFFGRMAQDGVQESLGKAGPEGARSLYLDAMNSILADHRFADVPMPKDGRVVALTQWEQAMIAEEMPVQVDPRVIGELAGQPYRWLSVGDLSALHRTGKQIHATATNRRKLLNEQKAKDMQALSEAIATSIGNHHELVPRARDWTDPKFDWVKEKLRSVDAWHTKPEFLFRWLDGDQTGILTRAAFHPIAQAQSAEAKAFREMQPKLEAVFDAIPKDVRRAWKDKRVRIGRSTLTGEQVFALGLNWGNAGNREALAAGQVDGQVEFPPDQLLAALGTLTAGEWQAIQSAWDLVDSYWPQISEMYQRLVGVAPEKVDASPFTITTPDGQTLAMKGGYYPLAYDRDYSWMQRKQDETQTVQEMAAWGYTTAATRNGHTVQRIGSGGKPVRLSLSVLSEHLTNVIHDLTHREAILGVRRVLRQGEVRTAIEQAAGREMYDTLDPWLNRIAADRLPPSSPMDELISRARRGATVVNMGFKVTTALAQPLGFLNSIEHIGLPYASKGMTSFLQDPQRVRDFVLDKSEEVRSRRENFDRDARDAVKRVQGESDWQQNVSRAALYFTGLADTMVAIPTWYGAYLKATDAGMTEAQAVQEADAAVRLTQGSGAPKDLARIQGGGEGARMFTMFYTYFSGLYNQFRRATKRVKGPEDIPRFLASMALLWFVPAIVGEIVTGRGPEDDEDWLEWGLWNLARYPAASVVGLRDVASAIGPDAFDYELSPVVEAGRSFAEAVNAVGGLAVGDELTRSEVKEIVEAVGYWGALPTRQGWITGSYLYDWLMGYESPESPVEATRNLMFTRPR